MTNHTLIVPAISCEHCERTVLAALTPLEGVETVQVDIPAHQVTIEFDESKIGVSRITDVLREEDYPVAAIR